MMIVNVWVVTRCYSLRRDETDGMTEMKGETREITGLWMTKDKRTVFSVPRSGDI
jgi:hypothetical protein